jgi:hypothetical protein
MFECSLFRIKRAPIWAHRGSCQISKHSSKFDSIKFSFFRWQQINATFHVIYQKIEHRTLNKISYLYIIFSILIQSYSPNTVNNWPFYECPDWNWHMLCSFSSSSNEFSNRNKHISSVLLTKNYLSLQLVIKKTF